MHMHGVVHVRGACVLQRIAPLRCPCGTPAVPLRCPCGAPAVPLRCPCDTPAPSGSLRSASGACSSAPTEYVHCAHTAHAGVPTHYARAPRAHLRRVLDLERHEKEHAPACVERRRINDCDRASRPHCSL